MSTYVPRVTVYSTDRGLRDMTPAEALEVADKPSAVVILGRMREGYLGREVVTADDLRRWTAEDDDAAEWAYVTAAERAAAEMGALR